MANKVRFGLRSKILVLTSILAFSIIGYSLFYALPIQHRSIITSFTHTAKTQSKTAATVCVSPLLKQNYALVYEILDTLLEDNPNWKHLRLTDATGKVIYPLGKWDEQLSQGDLLVSTDIVFLDEHLGKIDLIANYSAEIEAANKLQQQLTLALLGIVGALLAISFFMYERIITRPLSKLTVAFDKLAKQDYHHPLPFHSKDEIGLLINNFTVMRQNIAQYQQKLFSLTQNAIETNKQLKLAARVFENAHDGIMVTDPDGNIMDVNPAFTAITGYTKEDAIGQTPRLLNSGKHTAEFYDEMWQSLMKYGHWQGEIWNRKKDGSLYAQLLTISPLKNDLGKTMYYIGVFADVTQSKQQQETLQQLAHFDILTKLPNRTLFADRFEQAIAFTNRTKTQLAVCFLDLDNFKPVNDNYGHDVGDKLLIQVATRIKKCIRTEDTLSRLSGDEFAVLLSNLESSTSCEITLQRILEEVSRPYTIDEIDHVVTASIGYTIFPTDNSEVDTLLRHADQAMYHAKSLGRNCFFKFNLETDHEFVEKHHQLNEIRKALVNNEFQLYYQPKLDMQTGRIYGAEALIRWIHPEQGLLPPLAFLPVIEATDLEISISEWVIETALHQLDVWLNSGLYLEVSVNIPSFFLQSKDFINKLEAALARYPAVDSHQLQLEILESSILFDINAISEIISTCQKALGVTVALDDFGTGYSSLTHLRAISADTIKIDQSFIRDVLDDPDVYTLVDSVIGLAESFNREVIAEGVEETDHGLMLIQMGCLKAQGYAIAKPMPAERFTAWLNEFKPDETWLAAANHPYNAKQNWATLFRLIMMHWVQRFNAEVNAVPGNIHNWPIMGGRHDHCGQWLKRAQNENLFETDQLDHVMKVHKDFHRIAQEIQHLYLDGHIEAARNQLPEVQRALEEVMEALNQSLAA